MCTCSIEVNLISSTTLNLFKYQYHQSTNYYDALQLQAISLFYLKALSRTEPAGSITMRNNSVTSHLFAIVSPRAELHDASLLVKREVLDVNLTRGLVDGRRLPLDLAVREEGRLGGQGDLKVTVGTVRKTVREG